MVEDDGELRPLVMVMPKRFLVGVAVDAGLSFLGDCGSDVGRDCFTGEGLESEEVVEETGEVGSDEGKWMWELVVSPLASFLGAFSWDVGGCCPGSIGPIKAGRFSSLLGRRGLWPGLLLGPRTRRGDEVEGVVPVELLGLLPSCLEEELLPVALVEAAYEAEVAVLLAVLLIPF